MSYINDFALFSITEKSTTIPGIGTFTQSKAVPTDGLINVLTDFPWKIGGSTDEVPSIFVSEYELAWGQTVTNIQRALQLSIEKDGKRTDPYYAMYSGKETGFYYVFPQLIKNNDSLRSVSQSWNSKANTMMKNFTEGLGAAGDAAAGAVPALIKSIPLGIGKVAGGTIDAALGQQMFTNLLPAMGAEEVRQYDNTAPISLNINFPLYNTIDTASAYRNYSLVTLLTFQNLKTRTSFMTYIPPKIYKVECAYKGGVYIPVAFISKLDIKSIGTSRVLSEYGSAPILIPEGYNISITFQELISQSSNVFLQTMGGDKIEVIKDPIFLENKVYKAGQSVVDYVTKNQPSPTPAPTLNQVSTFSNM